MNDEHEDLGVGIVTSPTTYDAQLEPIKRFIHILQPISNPLVLFGGGYTDESVSSKISKFEQTGSYISGVGIIDNIYLQLFACIKIFLHRKEINVIYFQKGAMSYFIPVVMCRLLPLKTSVIKVGAFSNERPGAKYLSNFVYYLEYLAFRFSDHAIVFSDSERRTVPNNNTYVAFSNYRDFDQFDIHNGIEDRQVDIGFVGGFTKVKSVVEFSIAAKELAKTNPNIRIKMVGNGPLYNEVCKIVGDIPQIELTGWINHNDISDVFNDVKFIFMPSHAEGLPTTAIEAMGCGAIVVGTNVGSLSDLLDDGIIGFELPDNQPNSIYNTYNRVSTHEGLQSIVQNQRELVTRRYTLEEARAEFKKLSYKLAQADSH
ncbi:glycosyltransferase family 4 protein [Halorarius halobius]|uniref:glycosyltransferase family 4 protein n=1 Tax=Halorarius halobius TaxID=2962671 RepID=UPI0020CFD0FB|nr:glycosyltransferase family 4 protein [Halorarius halobius]